MSSNNSLKPLAGKRIVVTRAAEQARSLAQLLQAAGAEVLLLPLLRFLRAENTGPLDAALRDLGNFDWLIFTSANAARFLAQRGTELRIPLVGNAKATPHVAAVGPATASAAAKAGFPVEMVATHHNGRGLAAELVAKLGLGMRGARMLLPRGNRAEDALPSFLRDAGAEVTEVLVYRTEPPEEFDQSVVRQLGLGNVDVITLASPSSFHALVELVGRERIERIAQHTCIAAIGPTTAAAVREFSLRAPIQANGATPSGLVNAIIRHYQNQNQSSELNNPASHSAPVFPS